MLVVYRNIIMDLPFTVNVGVIQNPLSRLLEYLKRLNQVQVQLTNKYV